jgi:N-acetylglucosamine-6-phosphate deacetylase
MTPDLIFTGARLIGTAEPVTGLGWLTTSGGTIAGVGAGTPDDAQRAGRTVVDLHGQTLMPGFVDVHVHGAVGHEAMDGDVEGLQSMARFFASRGVTSFLPTTWTASRAGTLAALTAIAEARSSADGARILGAHMEGPYLSAARCGAQDPAEIRPVDRDEAAAFLDTGAVRMITVAPEAEGADDLLDECLRRGVTVSVGHTDATYEQVAAAIHRGARHMTHTFNAMSPLRHRAPGAVGAALALAGFNAEVIADEVHVHPAAVQALVRARGADEVVLVTDAIRPTGTTTSRGRLQGRPVAVRDGAVRFDDGQLVGSVLTMDRALRNVMRFTGQPLSELWPLVSRNPAAAAGVADRTGRIDVGLDADLVVLDDEHRVVRTLVAGRTVHEVNPPPGADRGEADADPDLSLAEWNTP